MDQRCPSGKEKVRGKRCFEFFKLRYHQIFIQIGLPRPQFNGGVDTFRMPGRQ